MNDNGGGDHDGGGTTAPVPRTVHVRTQRDVKQQDIDQFVAFCNTEPVQKSIGAYLASLANKKKKKKAE